MIWDPETLRTLATELEREADHIAGSPGKGAILRALERKLRAKVALYRKRATISEKARAA